MCLTITQLEPKIADKDIVCYKIVKRTKIKGIYKSSFQEFEYIIRQLYTNNLDIRFADKVIKNLYPSYPYSGIYYAVEEGMFHSFANCSHSALNHAPDEFIVKCIIPKGSYYFEGYLNSILCYASSQIKILEEI